MLTNGNKLILMFRIYSRKQTFNKVVSQNALILCSISWFWYRGHNSASLHNELWRAVPHNRSLEVIFTNGGRPLNPPAVLKPAKVAARTTSTATTSATTTYGPTEDGLTSNQPD